MLPNRGLTTLYSRVTTLLVNLQSLMTNTLANFATLQATARTN